MENLSPVKSLHKALALLDRLALGDSARQGVPLATLAHEFAMPVNTVHNLVKTLVSCGYAARISRGLYAAGPKCRQLARVAQCAEPSTKACVLRELHRFVDVEKEACVCSILANGERVMVGVVDSTHAVRVAQATVEAVPFFGRATGRMLAAMADAAELQQILDRQGLPGANWDGLADDDALRRELARMRKQGWCGVTDADQGLVGIACPVLLANGDCWGVLGAYAPVYRCDQRRCRQLLVSLKQSASALATALAEES